jgi:hypothetical protein
MIIENAGIILKDLTFNTKASYSCNASLGVNYVDSCQSALISY